MVFSRRGITRMRRPAMRDTSGPMLRCRFMRVFLGGLGSERLAEVSVQAPRDPMILRERRGCLCVVEQTLVRNAARAHRAWGEGGREAPHAVYRVASLGARLISLFCVTSRFSRRMKSLR